ncbi:MAG TPA: hypothetical protein VFC09_01215 [Candidatus Dormibacteraeota bacterium]|nr:hypothetical protein [Candidatus Dormibacteraeota bacterium]
MNPLRGARSAVLRALPLAPLAGVVAYAVVLAQRVPSLVTDTATSDSVGPMVIAESLPSTHPGSVVSMGNAAHYTTLWFDELTRSLPGHREIWQAMPFVLSLLGLLLLAFTVQRLRGWRAALITLGIGIATPPLLLVPLLAQAYHSTTFVNGIVLAALLVWLCRRPRVTAPHVVVVVSLAAVVTGLDVASDPLLLVTGVAPFVAAAVLVLWRHRVRRAAEVLVAVGGAAAVALVTAGVTALVMRHVGYQVIGLPLQVASPSRANANLTLLGHLVLDMGNGRLGLSNLGDLGVLRLVCGVLVVVGVCVPVWVVLRFAISPRRRSPSAQAEIPRRSDGGDADLARDAFLTFWAATAVFLVLAFVATTLALDTNSIRYLPPLFYSVAATVPFVRRQGAAALAVAFVGVTGAVLLSRAQLEADFNVAPQDAQPLIALLEQHGLHHGYAGYWQANLLTWESGGAVQSRAVQQSAECRAQQPGWFCPYPIFTVSDWYAPQGGPTFVIREHDGAFVPDPPPSTPAPSAVYHVDRFDVYVYTQDIGAAAAAETAGWAG